MVSGSRPGLLTALSIATVGTLLLACEGFSAPATSASTTLPRNVIVPLSEVSRFFPDIIREASTGPDLTATGNPKATRMVIYESGDGAKKVTITRPVRKFKGRVIGVQAGCTEESVGSRIEASPGTSFRPAGFRRDDDHGRRDAHRPRHA